MRVVAGTLRGRQIKAVPGMNTRPTLDKVKESLFNILGQFFAGGAGLDLFAGSGNLGIEALSRGLDTCVFVDISQSAVQVIKENLSTLKLTGCSEVYKMDALKALASFAGRYRFDYVFLDPPYSQKIIDEIIKKLVDYNLLNNDAVICVESLKEDTFLPQYKSVVNEKSYIYGDTKITIFRNGEENNE